MVRMRTINEAHKFFKKADPETAITVFYIRSLCKQNLVRSFCSGNRFLVDLDSLINFLSGKDSTDILRDNA